jgi:hypothetical protein
MFWVVDHIDYIIGILLYYNHCLGIHKLSIPWKTRALCNPFHTLLNHRAHQIYYMFWFLFIVFLILVITCAETTILLCYFHLCSEDYHWWWRAYLSSGSTALYFFLYSIYFYAGKRKCYYFPDT